MAVELGKYGIEAKALRESLKAETVVLIVINGAKGSGFSLCGTARVASALPDMLESIALEMRPELARDLEQVNKNKPTEGYRNERPPQ